MVSAAGTDNNTPTTARGSRSTVQRCIGRAAHIYVSCGGDPAACGGALKSTERASEAVNEEHLATLSPFGQEEYKLAIAMKNFRQLMKDEQEVSSTYASNTDTNKSPDAIRLRQQLRRAEPTLRQMQKQLNSKISSDEERDRYESMSYHIKGTLQRYSEMKQGGFVVPEDTRALLHSQGSTQQRNSNTNNITNINDLTSSGSGAAAYGSFNPREDEEFAQFFLQVSQKDQLMEAALDRVYVQTVSLRQNAQQINAELKVQDKLLRDVEGKVETQTAQLKSLNKRLTATIKEVKKSNLCLYISLFLLLVALIGAIYFTSTKK